MEPGFSEEDLLWEGGVRESRTHVIERARNVLDMIFNNDEEIFIPITAHGGIINAFLAVLGRLPYALPTGGVLPVVVRSVQRP
jgi:broad specificity phosphatase PhoE